MGLRSAGASSWLAAVALACQGQVIGTRPSGGVSPGGAGVGAADPSGALPADNVRGVSERCDPKAGASAEFAPLARLTRREYVHGSHDGQTWYERRKQRRAAGLRLNHGTLMKSPLLVAMLALSLAACSSESGPQAAAGGGGGGSGAGGESTAVGGSAAGAAGASTGMATAGTSNGGSGGAAGPACANPTPSGDLMAAAPGAETEATPLVEADFKDGAAAFHYAISAPKTFAAPSETDPAKQLGLFICFHEHFGMAHDEPPSVVEALARLKLSGQFVVIGMGQQAPELKGYDKVVDHENAVKLVEWAKKTYPINPRRVYLWGRGEGARMAMDLGAEHPQLFAGLITYSWGSMQLPKVESAALDVPDFYVVIGLDDYVTHPDYVRGVYAQLKMLGYNTIYREIPGLGGETKHPVSNDDAIAWASRLRHKTLPVSAAEQALLDPYADASAAGAICPDASLFQKLMLVGGAPAGKVMPALFGAQNDAARGMAAQSAALSLFGNDADTALVTHLRDPSADVRKATIQALGVNANWRYQPAQKGLIDFTLDRAADATERGLAVDAIGGALKLQVGGAFQDPPLFQALITLLSDPDAALRSKAFAILSPIMASSYQPDAAVAARDPEAAKWQQWLDGIVAKQ